MKKDEELEIASNIFEVAIFSKDENKRDEAKNDIIEFYKVSPECKKAADDVYKKTKEDFKGLENSKEYI